jgi:5-methylcytosine-specific restriction endonuclease McrA
MPSNLGAKTEKLTTAQSVRRKEERHRHYLKHRAEALQRAKDWRRNNHEKHVEACRRYYHEHREAAAKQRTENRHANVEREREAARRCYRNNRDKVLEKQKKYYQDNHEERYGQQGRYRATLRGQISRQCGYAARRARKLGIDGDFFTIDDVISLLGRQGKKCAQCQRPFVEVGSLYRFDIDHIVPLGLGSNGPENIQLLCRPCNQRKGNRAV